jgi:hypothetical protein
MITLLLLIGFAFFSFSILIALGIGIVEAPWPILLGILVLGLVGIKWMSMQGRAIAPSEFGATSDETPHPSSSEHPFKYRGVAYGEDPHHEDTIDEALAPTDTSEPPEASDSLESEDTIHSKAPPNILHGVYRGQPWQREEKTEHSENRSPSDIVYRGRRINTSPDQES